MKLYEIAIDKPQQSKEDLADYHSRLQDLRMKEVGSGATATVYQHPKSDTIVVKVGEDSESKLTIEYLRFALQRQNNPHVPKIYGVRRFKPPGPARDDAYFVAFIEKLTEYGKLSSTKKQAILSKYLGPLYTKGERVTVNALEAFVDPSVIVRLREQSRRRGVPSKALLDVLTFISQQNSDYLDLSDWNIMLRGNVPVITDPFI